MFCKYCGKPINPSPFCVHCGRRLVSTEEESLSTDPQQPPIAAVSSTSALRPVATSTARKQILIRVAVGAGLIFAAVLGVLALEGKIPQLSLAGRSLTQGDKYVAAVRNGVFAAPYNTTTVGKAFEATFTDPKWESKESDKGARFVEFTGRLKPEDYKQRFDLHKSCVDAAKSPNEILTNCSTMFGGEGGWVGKPEFRHAHTDAEIEIAASTVTFQFVFDAANPSSFRVGYIDLNPWANVSGIDSTSTDQINANILGFIYK
jgi:hypothetical protein